jgi:hypothetical protein
MSNEKEQIYQSIKECKSKKDQLLEELKVYEDNKNYYDYNKKCTNDKRIIDIIEKNNNNIKHCKEGIKLYDERILSLKNQLHNGMDM